MSVDYAYLIVLILGGKEAMKNGPAAFNVVASEHYKALDEEENKLLDNDIPESEKILTIRDIKREGSKSFRKIESQVFFYNIYLELIQ